MSHIRIEVASNRAEDDIAAIMALIGDALKHAYAEIDIVSPKPLIIRVDSSKEDFEETFMQTRSVCGEMNTTSPPQLEPGSVIIIQEAETSTPVKSVEEYVIEDNSDTLINYVEKK
jgi:hypothetical protein